MTWTEDDMDAAEAEGPAVTMEIAAPESPTLTVEACRCPEAGTPWVDITGRLGKDEVAEIMDGCKCVRLRAIDPEAMTVRRLMAELCRAPLDAQVVIGTNTGGATRHFTIDVVCVDEPDKPQTETVVIWPRTEGT